MVCQGSDMGQGNLWKGRVMGGLLKDQPLSFAGTCASSFPPVMCSRTPAQTARPGSSSVTSATSRTRCRMGPAQLVSGFCLVGILCKCVFDLRFTSVDCTNRFEDSCYLILKNTEQHNNAVNR